MAGETGPIHVSLTIAMVIAAFFGISCFNVIEIVINIFHTFNRWKGLYFWSMLVAALGILVHAIAVLLRFFALAPDFAMSVVTVIGWYAMVTGQAVVLYSRLHIVVHDQRKIRWVLIMIITNVFILHVPTTVLFLGSNAGHAAIFLNPFNIYEKIQLAGFCIQEFIISGLYIWETIHTLKPVLMVKGPRERRVVRHLIIINIFVVLMDVTLLCTEYTNNFEIQTTYKTAVYSTKLKMEFYILNELLFVLQGGNCTCYSHGFLGESTDPNRSTQIHLTEFNTGTIPSTSTGTGNASSIEPEKTLSRVSKQHIPRLSEPKSGDLGF